LSFRPEGENTRVKIEIMETQFQAFEESESASVEKFHNQIVRGFELSDNGIDLPS